MSYVWGGVRWNDDGTMSKSSPIEMLMEQYGIKSVQQLEEILKDYYSSVKTTKFPTLREFIDEHSNAAWITFDFKAEGQGFYCISTKDFVLEFGRRSEHILDDYVVVDYNSSCPSQSQGSTYFLELKKVDWYHY